MDDRKHLKYASSLIYSPVKRKTTDEHQDRSEGLKKAKIKTDIVISLDSRYRDPDANVILRSSDNVRFRVHDYYLKSGSCFFRDMLSLPAPPAGENGVIAVPEESKTFRWLVDLICQPEDDLDALELAQMGYKGIRGLVRAMDKYDVRRGGLTLAAAWEKVVIGSNAVGAFIFACELRREALAQVALRQFQEALPILVEGEGKVHDMRPWEAGGQYLASRISAPAFLSYVSACSTATYMPKRCPRRYSSDEDIPLRKHGLVHWMEAAAAFKLGKIQ